MKFSLITNSFEKQQQQQKILLESNPEKNYQPITSMENIFIFFLNGILGFYDIFLDSRADVNGWPFWIFLLLLLFDLDRLVHTISSFEENGKSNNNNKKTIFLGEPTPAETTTKTRQFTIYSIHDKYNAI